MSESTIQTAIMNYLNRLPGCVATNIHGGPMMQKGISDILACYKGHYIALETKQHTGDRSKAQMLFLRKVRRAGGIGEFAYGIEIVRSIIKCIDNGDTWEPRSKLDLNGRG